jgi:hypothetical protein
MLQTHISSSLTGSVAEPKGKRKYTAQGIHAYNTASVDTPLSAERQLERQERLQRVSVLYGCGALESCLLTEYVSTPHRKAARGQYLIDHNSAVTDLKVIQDYPKENTLL